MKLLSLFSGIGAFEEALKLCNIKYDLVNYCEIDKYASKSYSIIHNVSEEKNLGDITKVLTSSLPNDIDLITYGFPCTDISLAGRQQGFLKEDGLTRSGLFFESLRIIEDTQPKIAICENVKQLLSKKFDKEFKAVLTSLEDVGYNNYYQTLKSNDFGIPQTRERVFIVSIRKDIDNGLFSFPKGFPLKYKLKDFYEKEVSNEFYISDKMKHYISKCGTVSYKASTNINLDLARTLTTCPNKRCGVTTYVSEDLPDNCDLSKVENIEKYRIRRLTVKESFKLMGFKEEYVDMCKEKGLSNTQLYKQAGNSIVVDVLKYLFESLSFAYPNMFVKEV